MAGIRPLPFLGAEVSYDDLGRANGHYYYSSPFNIDDEARLSMRGETAYGVLYLPIHHFDLFAKAGVALVRSESSETGSFGPSCNAYEDCPFFIGNISSRLDKTYSDFAAGAGAQVNWGAWAIRAEYERFTAAGAHPSLVTAGVTWTL